MRLLKLLLPLCLVCCFYVSFSQAKRPKVKYGDVSVADFAPKVYDIDSAAEAVYLYDVGESYYKENIKAGFDVIYKRHARIRLVNKNSFDLATIKITLYKDNADNEEKLEDLDAATYNLEDGKVVVTKVDKKSIFKDKDGDYQILKFTFPNLKEGSIIEYDYELSSQNDFHINGWNFQGSYPRLWSEYSVSIPQYYDFVMMRQGYVPYVTDTVSMRKQTFNLADTRGVDAMRTGSIDGMVLYHTWAMANVPKLKEEEFTTTLDNHIATIEFQLSATRFPNQAVKPIMGNWMEFAKDMMQNEYFGLDLTHDNNWLDDDVKKITAGVQDDREKAKKIFEYVRDNYACTDNYSRYLSQPLKKTYQAKKGNVVDINLLLAAMLKNAGFDVHPVMLSTRDNGYPPETYPLRSKFNYVITQAVKGDKRYLLDASNPLLGFNCLSEECYNGAARLIADLPAIINLSADSLTESKVTTVFMSNDEKGLAASFSSLLGKEESQDVRSKLKKNTQENFFKDIQKAYPMEVSISNAQIDSLKMLEEPVTLKYDLSLNTGDEDLIYFSPMLGESYKENPFKAAERMYPVEMPSCMNETYILTMEIPKGYVIDELPKSARVKLNDDEGMFEYIIGQSGDHIQLRCRIITKKANYQPDDYTTLRDFFAFVVSKEAEQIVFKKQ